MLVHRYSFCKLLVVYVLDGFTLLMIPRLENAELLILCDAIVLKRCYVMLSDVLITLLEHEPLIPITLKSSSQWAFLIESLLK